MNSNPELTAERATQDLPISGAGWSAIVQGLLLFVPLIVLGAAVEWPASLDDSASVALPRLLENQGAVRFGYAAYLLYSILFAVRIVLLARLVESNMVPGLRRLIIGFAIASAIAIGLLAVGMLKSEAIPRWLGIWSVVAAIAVAINAVELFGVDLGVLLTVAVTVVQLWFLAVGIWLLARGSTLTRD